MTFPKLLRDPLLHFLGIGLLLFLLYGLVAPPATSGNRITISRATIDDMRVQNVKLWGREPTAAELKGMIDSRIQEEIFYREGLSMGLDKDDALIKRRVQQKYDLIAEEDDSVVPTEADLLAYLKAKPGMFRTAPIISFEQVMVPNGGSAADMGARGSKLKAALDAGADPANSGSLTLLPVKVESQALDLVARDFGREFAAALASLPTGKWAGPVPSAYGIHLVRIDQRTPAALPPLEAVRVQVQREWENDHRLKARDARIAELRKRYTVEVAQ